MTDPAARLGAGVGGVTASVGHRLVAAMLLASLAVALTVSALQLWGAYRHEREVAQQRLEEIGTSVVPSLAASCGWSIRSASHCCSTASRACAWWAPFP